jgi:hypothetical protein
VCASEQERTERIQVRDGRHRQDDDERPQVVGRAEKCRGQEAGEGDVDQRRRHTLPIDAAAMSLAVRWVAVGRNHPRQLP